MSSNALAQVAGTALAAPSLSEIAARLANNALGSTVTPPHDGGQQFVKFDGNTGQLTFGQANTALPADQRYVVPVMGMKHGWLFWENSKPEKATEAIVSALQPIPGKPDGRPLAGTQPKPKERDGWQTQWSVDMTGVDGSMDGIIFSWPGTARGYQQFWSGLVTQIKNQIAALLAAGSTEQLINPIIEIEVDDYYNDKYRRTIYNPMFVIHGWTDGFKIVECVPPIKQADGTRPAVVDPLAVSGAALDPLGAPVDDPLN